MTTGTTSTSPKEVARMLGAIEGRIAIMSHVNPDADAIGSTLGLTRGLCSFGKQAVAVLSDPVPEYARFLDGAGAIADRLPEQLTALVCVDAAGIDRVGTLYTDNQPLFERLPVLNIDHHRTNPLFGAVNYVDPHASSTSEMTYRLLVELGVPIDAGTANALMFGIDGDTGSFRNGATTPGSLEVAAHLVSLGADTQQIAFQLFERKTFAGARLWGQVIGGAELDRRRKIVFAFLTYAMLEREGVSPDELEGVAEYLRGIEEAEVVMLLKENADGSVRVSMRSRPAIDVSAIASALDGGGHRQAAGCTLPGPMAGARDALVAQFDACYPG